MGDPIVHLVLSRVKEPGTSILIDNVQSESAKAINLNTGSGGVFIGAARDVILNAPNGCVDVRGRPINDVGDPSGESHATPRRYVDQQDRLLERRAQPPTGVLSGGALSANAGVPGRFDLAAGSGVVRAGGEYRLVTWEARVAAAPSAPFAGAVTHVFVEGDGQATTRAEAPGPEDQGVRLYLGALLHLDSPPTRLTGVLNTPDVALNPVQQLRDLAVALGPIHLGGNVLGGVNKSLGFAMTEGSAFFLGAGFARDPRAPHTAPLPEFSTAAGGRFRYCFKNGS